MPPEKRSKTILPPVPSTKSAVPSPCPSPVPAKAKTPPSKHTTPTTVSAVPAHVLKLREAGTCSCVFNRKGSKCMRCLQHVELLNLPLGAMQHTCLYLSCRSTRRSNDSWHKLRLTMLQRAHARLRLEPARPAQPRHPRCRQDQSHRTLCGPPLPPQERLPPPGATPRLMQ